MLIIEKGSVQEADKKWEDYFARMRQQLKEQNEGKKITRRKVVSFWCKSIENGEINKFLGRYLCVNQIEDALKDLAMKEDIKSIASWMYYLLTKS